MTEDFLRFPHSAEKNLHSTAPETLLIIVQSESVVDVSGDDQLQSWILVEPLVAPLPNGEALCIELHAVAFGQLLESCHVDGIEDAFRFRVNDDDSTEFRVRVRSLTDRELKRRAEMLVMLFYERIIRINEEGLVERVSFRILLRFVNDVNLVLPVECAKLLLSAGRNAMDAFVV